MNWMTRDWRLIGMVASVAVTAAVVFLVVLGPSLKPPAQPAPRFSTAKDKTAAPPKSSARLVAPTTLHYYRFQVALDGTLKVDKHTFHLYAADVPGREYTCTYHNGLRWACGLRAYVALFDLVNSQLIEYVRKGRTLCREVGTGDQRPEPKFWQNEPKALWREAFWRDEPKARSAHLAERTQQPSRVHWEGAGARRGEGAYALPNV